jgi:predicted amidohydrolase
MKIALAQMQISPKDIDANLAHARELLKGISADVFLFPELFATGPCIEDAARFSENEKGKTAEFLRMLSAEKKAYAIGSFIEGASNAAGLPKKVSVVFDQNANLICKYEQIHLHSIAGETPYFSAGENIPYFDTYTFRSATFLSYDLRFPEAMREFGLSWGFFCFLSGAFQEDEKEHWLTLLRARAIENQFFAMGCNPAGACGEKKFCGNSAIFDPHGKCIAQADEKEQALVCEIDPFFVEWYRLRHQHLTDAKKFQYTGSVKASELDPEA